MLDMVGVWSGNDPANFPVRRTIGDVPEEIRRPLKIRGHPPMIVEALRSVGDRLPIYLIGRRSVDI